MTKLKNKTAIVTGGARGIGAAITKMFIEEGANVVIADILEKEGQELAATMGEKAMFVSHDVTKPEQWDNIIASAEDKFSGLDILVNNAGIIVYKSILDHTPEEMNATLNVNLYGTMLGTNAFGAALTAKNRAGAIVNMCSAFGNTVQNGASAYAASKWGIRGYTKAAAIELGPKNIRVNSVHPGAVYTELASLGISREDFDANCQMYASQRGCDPSEIAQAVLYLASEDSMYCMGTELVIDGGITAGHYHPRMPGHPAH